MSEIKVTERGISINEREPTVSTFHFWHRWTTWQTVRDGKTMNGEGYVTGYFKDQERVCKVCGKIQGHEVSL